MNRAVFLDRDGVINKILYEPDGNIMAPANLEQVKILDNVKEGIQRFKELGFKVIVVTNQPGVAFGYLKKEKLQEINNFLKNELGIDEIYSCTHHPKFDGECNCRKPKIGLIEQAKNDFDIDVENSYMVGDNLSDIETGKNANVKKTFRIGIIRDDMIQLQHEKNIYPDFTLPDLSVIADKIKNIEERERFDNLQLCVSSDPIEDYLYQNNVQLKNIELDFICDPWNLPMKDNSLNNIIALDGISDLSKEEFDKTIKKISSLLKIGGKLYLKYPNLKVLSKRLNEIINETSKDEPELFQLLSRWKLFSLQNVHEILKKSGFSKIMEGKENFEEKFLNTQQEQYYIYIKVIK